MLVRSLHAITNLVELLFPDYGFIVAVHPPAKSPGESVLVSNLEDDDVVILLQEYLIKHAKGEVHGTNGKLLKN